MRTTVTHDPARCPRCTFATATTDTGHVAGGYRLCDEGRAVSDAKMQAARDTNPQIAALHRMLGIG